MTVPFSHVHKACEHPAGTSVMSMRPAMLRRVRGEKWGVIMTRRLASEKENWWGCRLISSSTITTGESWPPAFWPERTVILCEAMANRTARSMRHSRLHTFLQEDHGSVAVWACLSYRHVSAQTAHQTWLSWYAKPLLHPAPDLTVKPSHTHTDVTWESKPFCNLWSHWKYSLHDQDINSIHWYEEYRLPPVKVMMLNHTIEISLCISSINPIYP